MHTYPQVCADTKASLATMRKNHRRIGLCLEEIKEDDHSIGRVMPVLRESLDSLTKAVHEFNAYHNVLHT